MLTQIKDYKDSKVTKPSLWKPVLEGVLFVATLVILMIVLAVWSM